MYVCVFKHISILQLHISILQLHWMYIVLYKLQKRKKKKKKISIFYI